VAEAAGESAAIAGINPVWGVPALRAGACLVFSTVGAGQGSHVTFVLVVEDEESISDALAYLMRKEGFEVAVCPTGPDALAAFDRDGADLVLLDLMLPGPAGAEVCRSLRQRSNVPVIMLTAKDTEVDRAVGLGLGADDYVTKPFTWRELLARIRAVLGS
jgi:two-component system, OmpR family, response regulator RegX3